jgi:hypothetical protein
VRKHVHGVLAKNGQTKEDHFANAVHEFGKKHAYEDLFNSEVEEEQIVDSDALNSMLPEEEGLGKNYPDLTKNPYLPEDRNQIN